MKGMKVDKLYAIQKGLKTWGLEDIIGPFRAIIQLEGGCLCLY